MMEFRLGVSLSSKKESNKKVIKNKRERNHDFNSQLTPMMFVSPGCFTGCAKLQLWKKKWWEKMLTEVDSEGAVEI